MVGKARHANSAETRRASKAVENAGLAVNSVRLLPDGTIELVTVGHPAMNPLANVFDRLEQAGAL